MNLNKGCYERIKDSFYYTEYLGLKLIVDTNTGYFNASQLCELGGRKYNQWKTEKQTQNLISFLIRNRDPCKGDLFYENKTQNKEVTIISGTYIHEDLLIDLALWISHEFYLKCKNILNHFAVKDYKNKLKEKESELKTVKTEVKQKDYEIYRLEKMIHDMKKDINKNNENLNYKLDVIIQEYDKHINKNIKDINEVFWKLYNKI